MSDQFEIVRLGADGTETPMPPVAQTGLYFVGGLRGHDEWESAERLLTDQHRTGGWEPGRYRVTVTQTVYGGGQRTVAEVTRPLPLPPAYAALRYTGGTGTTGPVRGFIVRLHARYPAAELGTVAEHWQAFQAHDNNEITDAELADRTGYQHPEAQEARYEQ